MNQLENILGLPNKAKDFEDFWTNQKRKIDEMKITYELKKTDLYSPLGDYYDLYFRSFDQALLHAKYIVPKIEGKKPVMIEFHDVNKASESWHHLSRYLAIDMAVIALDCRNQGGESKDESSYEGPYTMTPLMLGIQGQCEEMYYVKSYLDAYLCSRLIEKISDLDENKIATFGKGQGGGMAFVCACLNPNIKKCSVEHLFPSDIQSVYNHNKESEHYKGVSMYFRNIDSSHQYENEIFNRLSYIDCLNFSKYFHASLLMGTGLLDASTPAFSQYALFNQIQAQKKHCVYSKHEHELINFYENENMEFLRW